MASQLSKKAALKFLRHVAITLVIQGPCACLTPAVWRCRKPFSQWQHSFQRKLCPHWLKSLRQRHVALVRQGPVPCPWMSLFPPELRMVRSVGYGHSPHHPADIGHQTGEIFEVSSLISGAEITLNVYHNITASLWTLIQYKYVALPVYGIPLWR